MDSVSSHTPAIRLSLPEGKVEVPARTLVLPDLLRCLVLTWSESRADLLRAAARNESWQPTVNISAGEFLRNVFLLRVPLTFIDLPDTEHLTYADWQTVAERSKELSDSLVVVCGVSGDPVEELWARQLGAWAYLPGDGGQVGLEMVFGDARKAVANKALVCVELDGYR